MTLAEKPTSNVQKNGMEGFRCWPIGFFFAFFTGYLSLFGGLIEIDFE